MSDLVRALAFAFRRKGAQTIPGSDLRLLLAYDLRWFAPEDAKRVVQRAVDSGLLVEEAGALRPSFDVAAVEIPLNFKPSLDVLEEEIRAPSPGVSHDALGRAADDERRKRGLLVSPQAARLIVRRRAGEDVTAAAAALEAEILASGAPARPGSP